MCEKKYAYCLRFYIERLFCIFLSIILILTICSIIMVSYADENIPAGVNELMKRLESAYNHKELYDILDCYEPSIMKATMAATKLLGLNADAIENLAPLASSIFASYLAGSTTNWPTCEITLQGYSGDDYYGEVIYHVEFTYANGHIEKSDTSMSVKQVDGVWYIAALQTSDLLNNNSAETGVVISTDVTAADFDVGLDHIVSYKGDYSHSGRYDFVNKDGKVLFTGYYSGYEAYDDRYAWMKSDGVNGYTQVGAIDLTGKVIVDFAYWKVESLDNGYWKVYNGNGQHGIINLVTGESIPCIYNDFGYPNEGYIPAKKDGYWGVLDLAGNIVIDFIYTEMDTIVNQHRIGVGINGAGGLIDLDGKFIVPLNVDYYYARTFQNGLYVFKDHSHIYHYYSADGKLLLSLESNNSDTEDLGDGIAYIDKKLFDAHDCIVDYVSIAEQLPEPDGYSFSSCDVFPETYNGKRMLIGIKWKTPVTGFMNYSTIYKYFLVDTQGKLLTEEGYSGSYIKEVSGKDLIVISQDKSLTLLYKDKQFIFSAEAGVSPVLVPSSPNYDPYDLTDAGNLIYHGKDISWYFDFDTQMAYTFNSIKGQGNKTACEVSDGIFMGVLTSKGLLGNGIAYTKVNIHYNCIVELEYGHQKTTVYVGKNGTAFEYNYETHSNSAFPLTPLSNGILVNGTQINDVSKQHISEREEISLGITAELVSESTPVINVNSTQELIPKNTAEPTYMLTPEPTLIPTEEPLLVMTEVPIYISTSIPSLIPMEELTAVPKNVLPETSASLREIQTEQYETIAYIVCDENEIIDLYQGPGTSFRKIASLQDGTPVTVLLEDENWVYIIIDNYNGFLEKRYISTYHVSPLNGKENLYDLPESQDGDVLLSTPNPTVPIDIQNIATDMVFPTVENETEKPEIVFTDQSNYHVQSTVMPAYPKTAQTNVKKVNVRERTDTESRLIVQIVEEGTSVNVLAEVYASNGIKWYFVQLDNGNLGYIRGDLLFFIDETSNNKFTSMDYDREDFHTVSAQLVYNKKFDAYSGPGTYYVRGANGKAYMTTNDTVYAYGRVDDWLLVQYNVSSTQWRFAYIKIDAIVSPEMVPWLSFSNQSAMITYSCTITDDPLHSKTPLVTISANTYVTVLMRMNEWAYIECGNVRGFIPNSCLFQPGYGQ